MTKSNKGFSLLELLIVVAIILIIATIAIPSLLKSRQAAHEAAAVATLRTINTAEVTYLSSSNGNYGTIADLIAGAFIPSNFGGTVSGYNFSIVTAGGDFTVSAVPASSQDGRYGYYITPDGTVRYSTVATLAPTPAMAGAPVSQ